MCYYVTLLLYICQNIRNQQRHITSNETLDFGCCRFSVNVLALFQDPLHCRDYHFACCCVHVFWSVTMFQPSLIVHDLDRLEEYWSGALEMVPQFGCVSDVFYHDLAGVMDLREECVLSR